MVQELAISCAPGMKKVLRASPDSEKQIIKKVLSRINEKAYNIHLWNLDQR